MDSPANFSTRSPAVKRLMQEAKELQTATEMYHAHPVDDNLFDWHFTVRGACETAFAGGIYHGRISLPADYPMKPPSIMLFTPNGRFSLNRKICLSISGHHPETWQPSWSIRTALLAIIGFMPTPGHGAIGSLDYTDDERRALAMQSANWTCKTCKTTMKNALPPLTDAISATDAEAKELAKEISFKGATTEPDSPMGVASPEAADATTQSTQQQDTANDTAPRVRRRRRVPRVSTASYTASEAAAPTDYNVIILNMCIVLCLLTLALLLARRYQAHGGSLNGPLDVINEVPSMSNVISPNGHRSVEPLPPPSNRNDKRP